MWKKLTLNYLRSFFFRVLMGETFQTFEKICKVSTRSTRVVHCSTVQWLPHFVKRVCQFMWKHYCKFSLQAQNINIILVHFWLIICSAILLTLWQFWFIKFGKALWFKVLMERKNQKIDSLVGNVDSTDLSNLEKHGYISIFIMEKRQWIHFSCA